MPPEWMREIRKMFRQNPDLAANNPILESAVAEDMRGIPAWKKESRELDRLGNLGETEHDIQSRLFRRLEEMIPEFPELRLAFAIPNGGDRNPVVGAMLKAEGVKRGVLDMFLPVARGMYHGFFIEMKRPGGRTSAEQRQWISELMGQGYQVEIHYSDDSAIRALLDYLAMDDYPGV